MIGFLHSLTNRKATYFFHCLVGVNLVPCFLIQNVLDKACEIEIVLKNKILLEDRTVLLENLSFDQRHLC